MGWGVCRLLLNGEGSIKEKGKKRSPVKHNPSLLAVCQLASGGNSFSSGVLCDEQSYKNLLQQW